jgi:hypothetical protein
LKAVVLLLLVGSLDMALSKKTHHHKTFKKGHKKTMTQSMLVPSLPTKDKVAPQNQLEIQKEPILVPAAPVAPLDAALPILNNVNNGKHSMK